MSTPYDPRESNLTQITDLIASYVGKPAWTQTTTAGNSNSMWSQSIPQSQPQYSLSRDDQLLIERVSQLIHGKLEEKFKEGYKIGYDDGVEDGE